MVRRLAVLLLLAAACSSGVAAPAPGEPATVCTDEFCVSYPDDWDAEPAETFVTFFHPLDPLTLVASASRVDMEGVMDAGGEPWPAPPDRVVRTFWRLLEEGGPAGLDAVETRDDGSVVSEGGFESGRLWTRMIPVDGPDAIGIEVRAPNKTWAAHAEVFLDGLAVLP
jgi:hypothetical protein